MTTTYRIDLAYHGGGFAGWAIQPGERTVEAELSTALETVTGGPTPLTVAGRTDAGVHALGQVASFEAGPLSARTDLRRALTGLTAVDIDVRAVTPQPGGFDARQDARSRTYCYRLQTARSQSPFERGLALWWPYPLDRGALAECAASLLGSNDFTAFTPTKTKHKTFQRDILRSEWYFPEGEEGICEYWIESPAFMHGQVRALVGTMLDVARGRRGAEDFRRLLGGAPRAEAGDSAQPQGLYLAEVSYGPGGAQARS